MSELSKNSFADSLSISKIGAQGQKRAILVEDVAEFHDVVLEALLEIPGSWSLSSFFNGQDAIDFASTITFTPDVVIVDLGLPDIDGISVIRHFHELYPASPILIFTIFAQKDKVLRSFEAGAHGYVLKNDDVFCTAKSIKKALDGEVPISPAVGRYAFQRNIRVPDFKAELERFNLSKRELELLMHLSDGNTYTQAAHLMKLKTSTVHSYSKSLFKKLGVNTRSQAVSKIYALRAGTPDV